MKQLLCLFLLIFSMQTFATEIESKHIESTQRDFLNHPCKLELILSIPTRDLIISEEGIGINFNGKLLNVHSLEREGENWKVRIGFTCKRGHSSICWYCHGCATPGCPFQCPGGCREY